MSVGKLVKNVKLGVHNLLAGNTLGVIEVAIFLPEA
jgi:hypothetical protein